MKINKNLHASENISQFSLPEKIVGNLISLVANTTAIICGHVYNISGQENIPKDTNFLLVANHPGLMDYFPIKHTLNQEGINIDFFAHKNICTHFATRKFAVDNGLLGVRRFNNGKPLTIPGASKHNLGSLREGISRIQEGGNLGIFISGQGYLPHMDKIFGGYKFITKKFFTNGGTNLTILPVVIKEKQVQILPVSTLEEYSLLKLEEIEESMRRVLS